MIIQTVSHRGRGYQYPIVADPFLGKRLFTNFTRDTYSGDWLYNGSLTLWGGTVIQGGGGVGGAAAGQAIIRSYGWSEWKAV